MEEYSLGPELALITSSKLKIVAEHSICQGEFCDDTSLSLTSQSFQAADEKEFVGPLTNPPPLVIDCGLSGDTIQEAHNLGSWRPMPAPRQRTVVDSYGPANKKGQRPAVVSDFDSEIKNTKRNTAVSVPLPVFACDPSNSARESLQNDTPPQPFPRLSLCNTSSSAQVLPTVVDEEQMHEVTSAGVLEDKVLPRVEDTTDRMFRLRNYQEEVGRRLHDYQNDIIILPTGTGKTPIAVSAIYKHLRDYEDNSNKQFPKILFLAPRVVLVEQQLEVIKSHLPVYWAEKCTKLTGGDISSMDDLEILLTDTKWAVIAATPQTVFNYFLAFNSSTMKKFSLIVFDECHNARGGDAYNRLLNQYMDEKFLYNSEADLPQLAGLTATTGIGGSSNTSDAQNFIISLCSRFNLRSHPSEVREYIEELEAIRNPPVEVYKHVEEQRSDPFSKYIKERIITQILADVTSKLRNTPKLRQIFFKPPTDVLSQGFEQKCVVLANDLSRIHDSMPDDVARDLIISTKHLRVYQQAVSWANLAQLSDAMSYLNEELSRPELSGNSFFNKYEGEWRVKLQELADNEAEYPNSKLAVLKQELDIALSSGNRLLDEQPRVMIFVEYRRLAHMLRDWISGLGSGYRVEKFVSRLVSPGDFGMTSEESRAVMERFRSGDLNVLVATSVLSEGVDIPACNGTIRYLYMKDVIAEVQIPGRMRSWGGRVVALVNQKLHERYLDNKRKEKLMYEALKKIRQIPEGKFVKLMEEEQERSYRERLALKTRHTYSTDKPTNSAINCQQCGMHVGQLNDVYRYLEAHYIILDSDLLERIEIIEGPEYTGSSLDGMTDVGLLTCKQSRCRAELGKVIRIKICQSSRRLGIWNIEKIRLVSSQSNFSKWEQVCKKFRISDIKQEELRDSFMKGCMLN